jgi:hypothetical protein
VLALWRHLCVAQQARDPPGLVELIVPVEAELRGEAKVEPRGQLVAEEGAGRVEAAE